MRITKAAFALLIDAGVAWSQDKASLFAAAIAYYMAFSIAPMLVLSIALASRVFSQALIEGQMVAQIQSAIGPDAALLLQNLLRNATAGSSSFTIISALVLLWAASGVFTHLKRALDIIYGVMPRPMPTPKGALNAIRDKFLSFAMVLFIGVLLLVALTLNTVVTAMGSFLVVYFPNLAEINTGVTKFIAPAIMFFLFGIIFKTMPDARIAWRDTWLGAGVTTLLLSLGNFFIGVYLSLTHVGSVYGAAGSLIIVLVWIYYAAQIVMYGAEFTKIFAIRYGSGIEPRDRAMTMAEYYSDHTESSANRNRKRAAARSLENPETDDVEEIVDTASLAEQE